MYSAMLFDHFQNPRNPGELPPPAVTVEVNNPACGDIMRLSLIVEQGVVREVRFKTRGCVPAIACGSVLTEMIKGKPFDEAEKLSARDIVRNIGGLPAASIHAASLAEDALRQAIKAARKLSGNGAESRVERRGT